MSLGKGTLLLVTQPPPLDHNSTLCDLGHSDIKSPYYQSSCAFLIFKYCLFLSFIEEQLTSENVRFDICMV